MSMVFYEARQARRKKFGEETWEKESDTFPFNAPTATKYALTKPRDKRSRQKPLKKANGKVEQQLIDGSTTITSYLENPTLQPNNIERYSVIIIKRDSSSISTTYKGRSSFCNKQIQIRRCTWRCSHSYRTCYQSGQNGQSISYYPWQLHYVSH